MVHKSFSWRNNLGIQPDKGFAEVSTDAQEGRTQSLTITSQEHYLLSSGFQERVLLSCLRSEGPQSDPLRNQVWIFHFRILFSCLIVCFMFLAASVFITHGTKQVQVDGLIKWKGAFSLKKKPKRNKAKPTWIYYESQRGKKERKALRNQHTFSAINNQFLQVFFKLFFSHQQLQRVKSYKILTSSWTVPMYHTIWELGDFLLYQNCIWYFLESTLSFPISLPFPQTL